MYEAKVIADSISPTNRRIITMEVVMPRFILAEFNTHRMFSRNSASSRAIPFRKMADTVQENPFTPLRYMKDHSGMQGNQYLDEAAADVARMEWIDVSVACVQSARILNKEFGLTKQMCNRLLEPFMWHKVLVTATEWENFFAQRYHEHAEIHMQHVAELMLKAANDSTPRSLKAGEWHIPYGDQIDGDELMELIFETVDGKERMKDDLPGTRLKYILAIATMRCAQVSYTLVGEDGKSMNLAKLYELFNTKLLPQGHWSPFEHSAECMGESMEARWIRSPGNQHGWCGNFRGWKQFRKQFDAENRTDHRFIKKTYGTAN